MIWKNDDYITNEEYKGTLFYETRNVQFHGCTFDNCVIIRCSGEWHDCTFIRCFFESNVGHASGNLFLGCDLRRPITEGRIYGLNGEILFAKVLYYDIPTLLPQSNKVHARCLIVAGWSQDLQALHEGHSVKGYDRRVYKVGNTYNTSVYYD